VLCAAVQNGDLVITDSEWLAWVLAGAFGGLVTILSAMALGVAQRRRARTLFTGSLPQSAPAGTVGAAAAGEPATVGRTMPLVDEVATVTPPSAADADGARPFSCLAPGCAVIGYVTVARDPGVGEESESESLTAIEARCARSGWKLIKIVRDRENGRVLDRPGLGYALGRIAAGDAQGLVVCDLERLGRSITGLGVLMAWFRDAQATLIALDLDIDTSTPEGRQVAATLIALSVRDHERIASGTRRGLAEGRADGRPVGQRSATAPTWSRASPRCVPRT
jgi:DNA invertase Pin-like site-specific DNA recombinase